MADERICSQDLGSASRTATVREIGSVDGGDEDTPARKRSSRHLSDTDLEASRCIRFYLGSKIAAGERRSNLEELRLEMDKQRHERRTVAE